MRNPRRRVVEPPVDVDLPVRDAVLVDEQREREQRRGGDERDGDPYPQGS